MPFCQFSETQFEAYHSRAFERVYGSFLPQFFPTRQEEGFLGVDMVHFTHFENYFFQYKVPYYLSRRSRYCGSLEGNYFHFHVYNNTRTRQYQKLKEWSVTESNVYYAAPKFGTNQDFAQNYTEILRHTALFNLRDPGFPARGTLEYDQEHEIYYSDASNFGYLYSEPKKIKETLSFENIESPKFESLDTAISSIVRKLLGVFQINDGEPQAWLRNDKLEQLLNKTLPENKRAIELDLFLRQQLGVVWVLRPRP